MNREYKNQKGKETIIKEIRERLRWYTFEASEEEIDPKEMAAMVKLLEVLEEENREPEESMKEAYARFRVHRDQWEADEAEISALREQETLHKAEEKGRRKFVPGLGRKMGAKKAGCGLFCCGLICGSIHRRGSGGRQRREKRWIFPLAEAG